MLGACSSVAASRSLVPLALMLLRAGLLSGSFLTCYSQRLRSLLYRSGFATSTFLLPRTAIAFNFLALITAPSLDLPVALPSSTIAEAISESRSPEGPIAATLDLLANFFAYALLSLDSILTPQVACILDLSFAVI